MVCRANSIQTRTWIFADTLEYVDGQPTKNMNKEIHFNSYVLPDRNIKCKYKKMKYNQQKIQGNQVQQI